MQFNGEKEMRRKKQVTVIEAILAFKKNMQKICNDPKSGVTSISISSPTLENNKEIVIAKKEVKK